MSEHRTAPIIVPEPANVAARPWLIVLAASMGGVNALQLILSKLPSDLPAAVVIVLHRSGNSMLEHVLRFRAKMPVDTAIDGDRVEPGMIYVARPDAHLTITGRHQFLHVDGKRRRFLRSSANPLLESAAEAFQQRAIAVVLTGSGTDATDGVQTIRRHGGIVIAQDETTANHFGMPSSAINTGVVNYVLPLEGIAPALVAIVNGQPVEQASRDAVRD